MTIDIQLPPLFHSNFGVMLKLQPFLFTRDNWNGYTCRAFFFGEKKQQKTKKKKLGLQSLCDTYAALFTPKCLNSLEKAASITYHLSISLYIYTYI